MSTEPWVTADHVAQHLGVAKDTVYRWRERKGLPAHRVGRLWKFQLSEVDEWVRAGGADEDVGEPGVGIHELHGITRQNNGGSKPFGSLRQGS
ncbi:helix-turn-helix domain-containing protein [Vogesella fluminis]